MVMLKYDVLVVLPGLKGKSERRVRGGEFVLLARYFSHHVSYPCSSDGGG